MRNSREYSFEPNGHGFDYRPWTYARGYTVTFEEKRELIIQLQSASLISGTLFFALFLGPPVTIYFLAALAFITSNSILWLILIATILALIPATVAVRWHERKIIRRVLKDRQPDIPRDSFKAARTRPMAKRQVLDHKIKTANHWAHTVFLLAIASYVVAGIRMYNFYSHSYLRSEQSAGLLMQTLTNAWVFLVVACTLSALYVFLFFHDLRRIERIGSDLKHMKIASPPDEMFEAFGSDHLFFSNDVRGAAQRGFVVTQIEKTAIEQGFSHIDKSTLGTIFFFVVLSIILSVIAAIEDSRPLIYFAGVSFFGGLFAIRLINKVLVRKLISQVIGKTRVNAGPDGP